MADIFIWLRQTRTISRQFALARIPPDDAAATRDRSRTPDLEVGELPKRDDMRRAEREGRGCALVIGPSYSRGRTIVAGVGEDSEGAAADAERVGLVWPQVVSVDASQLAGP
jgi:hypothetical protein